MNDLEPTETAAIEQGGSSRFEPGRKSRYVGSFPIGLEETSVLRTNGDKYTSRIPALIEFDVHRPASVQFCAADTDGLLASIEEP